MIPTSIRTTLAAAALACVTLPAQAGEIVWARYGDIDSLDPHKATSTLSLQVWRLMYDSLLGTDATGAPVPHVAKSWTTNDAGTEYMSLPQ